MKLKILIAAIAVSGMTATAQVRVGAEAGVNVSHGYDMSETKAGFNVGVTGEYSFTKNWFIDAALKLSSQPCADKYTFGFENGSAGATMNVDASYTPYYLTLPVRIGYGFRIADDMRLSVAAGPMIGMGLFGRGKVSTATSGASGAISHDEYKITNPFDSNKPYSLASSRFEYGADIKVALEMKRHYTVGLDYSILHISGNSKAVDNMGVFSVNIGYKF